MTDVDHEALVASLRRLRGPSSEGGIVHHLERIVQVVARILGYAGAGLMLADDGRALRGLFATDEPGRAFGLAQVKLRDGPSFAAFDQGEAVFSTDVPADRRWPELAGSIDPAVRAVASIPVRLGATVGTLDVYQAEPYTWDESDVELLHDCAQVIEQVLAAAIEAEEQARLADQLQYALDYRVLIERAIGYLMGKDDMNATEAFNGLRKRARDSRRTVADLAAELLRGAEEEGPDDPAAS
ncbi:GAF and ANTAR domain-containing protein [Streptosporangiaceae bacterium NEAU-GS5]|nr:GAF and ANTAR domain-containing protein [Streptosporangiaceae bacterium NEAU-GS5]